MGEAKRRKVLGLRPKTKKRPKKKYASCEGTFQLQGSIRIPGLRY